MQLTTEAKPKAEAAEHKKTSVKAIVIEQYGGPEVLKLRDTEIGSPGRGQALVRLAMAGVNFVDIYQRRGTYASQLPFTHNSTSVVDQLESIWLPQTRVSACARPENRTVPTAQESSLGS